MKIHKGKGKREKGKGRGIFFDILFFSFTFLPLSFCLTSCGPEYTYPSDTIVESVERILLQEDQIEAEAKIEGKTLGAVVYLDALVDPNGQVPKEVHEKMGQVMQALTRVALSTDLPIDYCVAVVRDKKQGNELTVTRSVDDTRRANADAIGIEESINRTVFAQGHYTADPLGGAPGFVLKEVTLTGFLAEQIAQRIRFSLAKESKDAPENPLVLADGSFMTTNDGRRVFHFSMIGFKSKDPGANILDMLKIVSGVFRGYRFTEFDSVEMRDYLNRQKLVIDRQVFAGYQAKKIKESEILERYLSESQSVQEAFKLFGFSLPASEPTGETDDAESPGAG